MKELPNRDRPRDRSRLSAHTKERHGRRWPLAQRPLHEPVHVAEAAAGIGAIRREPFIYVAPCKDWMPHSVERNATLILRLTLLNTRSTTSRAIVQLIVHRGFS